MTRIYETDILTDLEEDKAVYAELKAVQVARMSTLVLALLTTVITIFLSGAADFFVLSETYESVPITLGF